MIFWFPTVRRVLCRYAKSRQKYLIAFADDLPYELDELCGAETVTTPDPSGRNVTWHRLGDDFYRRVFHNGEPASADHIANASPHLLFYGWNLPTSMQWQDHPCARNVTFEPQLVAPISEITGDVRYQLGNEKSSENIDGDQAALYARVGIDGCRAIKGAIVKKAPAPSVVVTSQGQVRLHVAGIDAPAPYSIHFGFAQGKEADEYYRLAFGQRLDLKWSYEDWPVIASAESAARDTLISAVSVLMNALAKVPVGHASLDEIDLIVMARNTLVRSDHYSCVGVLWAFADCLMHSNSTKLQELGRSLDLRRQVLDDPDEDLLLIT